MSDIPTDVYREILRRVPVDSLFQLRSVCKSWCRIIDDPQFAKRHNHRGIGDGWIMQREPETGKLFILPLKHFIYRRTSVPHVEWINGTNVKAPVRRCMPRIRDLPVPSCNGLILISSCNKNLVWVIWNPFTGESFKLPLCNEFPSSEHEVLCTPHGGLGYDEATDDYKVVRIARPHTFICSVRDHILDK